MKVFVPFSEELIEKLGLGMGDLVPFNLDYECLRTQDADDEAPQPAKTEPAIAESKSF